MRNHSARPTVAAVLSVALTAGALTATAPAAHAATHTEVITIPAKTTTDAGKTGTKVRVNVNNANATKGGDFGRGIDILGAVIGLIAVLATLGFGWFYFAAPHLGFDFGFRG